MKINLIELANVLVVIVLLFQLTRKRGTISLLVVLFVYGTLHFGFASIALATNESAKLLIALHNEGGGLLAKLSSLSLLSVAFVLLAKKAYSAYWVCLPGEKKITGAVLVAITFLALGYAFNLRQGDWLQFNNFVSLEACWC